MFPVYACVSSLEGRDLCTHLHTYTHKHAHSQMKQQAASTLHQKKALLKISLLLQNTYTCILIILLHYHLAGDLVLINCQKGINHVEIVYVHSIRYAYIVQNTSDIIYRINFAKLKYF